jgi:capsid protein
MFKRYRFIDDVCYPAMREIAANMVISGAIEAPGFFDSDYIQRAWLSGIWLGPVPGYINPLQEITARAKSVENGFENRADAMFHISGADFEDAMREHHRQEALFAGTPEEQRAQRLIEDMSKNNGEQE